MRIGTVRPEEARVFDSAAGYHQFHNEDGTTLGSYEVFWFDGVRQSDDDCFADSDDEPLPAGWYWRSCFPGCMPDGDPTGPFASSTAAMYDADEYHPDNKED